MREVKFRAWHNVFKHWLDISQIENTIWVSAHKDGDGMFELAYDHKEITIVEYTGLKDKNGREIYEGDVGRFDNGDTFVIRSEEWVEIFCDWIGEPECEDQARDLYRISNAEVIGNIYENPELTACRTWYFKHR